MDDKIRNGRKFQPKPPEYKDGRDGCNCGDDHIERGVPTVYD